MLDDGNRIARGHHPIRSSFDGGAGVGINDDLPIRVVITETAELIDGYAVATLTAVEQRRPTEYL